MKKDRRAGLYIRQRDLDLFDYLYCYKIATARQINRDIFHIADVDAVTERLCRLYRQGYLRRSFVDKNVPRYGYFLSDKAFQKYISSRTERSWHQLKSECPDHDMRLVDIGERFKKSDRVVHYLTENAIESSFDCPPSFPVNAFCEMHSDAGVVFRKNGKTFNLAIEYEDSPKKSSQYDEHFANYYVKDEIKAVIYIVENDSLRTRIMEIERKVSSKITTKFFFGKLSDVLNPEKELAFTNHLNEVLLFG